MYPQISATVSHEFVICAEKIVNNPYFSHIGEIMVIFVSTYMLHLPDKTLLEEFMRKEIKEFEDKE